MRDITKTEMDVIIRLIKSPEIEYNANSLSKVIGVSPMGALKILKRLVNESILKTRKIGRATIYRANIENPYAIRYLTLILSRESLHASQQIKRWIEELKKLKNADMAVLFGSVIEKQDPNDIDVLLMTDQKRFAKLEKEIKELNELNIKKIHPLYQTFDDLISNIKKKDMPMLNAIKGIIVFGEEKFIEVYNESCRE